MKKQFAALLTALSLLPTLALAQEYYTLPEIREQAKDGWHETYTDRYGREIQVDIDADVFGEQTAPLIKAGFPQHDIYYADKNCPYNTVSNVKRKGGRRTHIYRSYGSNVDLDRQYGADYGNDLTLNEMYAYMNKLITDQGIPNDIFLYERPKFFDVLCNIQQSTGEVKATAFYFVQLYEQFHGIPVLTSKTASFNQKRGWPDYEPNISFQMRNEDEFSIMVDMLEEMEIIAEDVPLCAFESIKENIRNEIVSGHIRKVFSLRFGYSVYNDPNYPSGKRSVYDADCYYLVPSWVLECIYINDPKESYSYDEEQIENDSNSTERTTDKFITLTINAQTGEVTNPMDKSKNGWGDADYKGFISWNKVKQ